MFMNMHAFETPLSYFTYKHGSSKRFYRYQGNFSNSWFHRVSSIKKLAGQNSVTLILPSPAQEKVRNY